MNDYLEQMYNNKDALQIDKEEAKVLLDYYKNKLKLVTDNSNLPQTRVEIQEEKLKQITTDLRKVCEDILAFEI